MTVLIAIARRSGIEAVLRAYDGGLNMRQFYDCGICGHWHPVEWNGDCREDANRWTTTELEATYFRDECKAVDAVQQSKAA